VTLKSKISEREYFAHEHVIVSYNGDLRGVIEDMFGKARRVRCSLGSFSHIGEVIEGSTMLATVPTVIVDHILSVRPNLCTAQLPFSTAFGSPLELLWPTASDDDEACRFLRDQILGLLGGAPVTPKKPAKPRKDRPERSN
jgi:LysR family transcriptional activator of mexEF-oprN operon